VWTTFATINHSNVTSGTTPEDSFMWIDKRENWHIINHAVRTVTHAREWRLTHTLGLRSNASPTHSLSTHFFSPDGKSWRSLPGTGMGAVQPYSHTVNYVDGTSHTLRERARYVIAVQLAHCNT